MPARDRDDVGTPVLEVRGARVRFGGVVAVDGIDLAIAPGEMVGIIGPNGAGKSTLLDVISGFVTPDEGHVLVAGRDVTHEMPYRRARLGLARSFQDARLFPAMTVRETLLGAFHERFTSGAVSEGLGLEWARAEEAAAHDELGEVLELVALDRYLDHRVSDLSFGTTRALELAALAARHPLLLLLDEPAAGLQQSEVAVMGELIHRLRRGAATVVIDHDVPFVADVCERMVAMDLGRIVASGRPDDVLAAPEVVDSYLGGSTALTGANR